MVDAVDVNEMRSHSTAVLGAAAASVGAALVHAAAAGTHGGASDLVTLFAVTAAAQALVAGAVAFSATRTALLALAGVNTVAVVAWALSRTTGLPWPELLQEAEDVGSQDLAAAALGAAAAVLAGLAVLDPAWARAKAAPTALAGAACTALLAVAVPGMAAQHDHDSASHAHGHAGDPELAAAGGAPVPLADHHATGVADHHAVTGAPGVTAAEEPAGPIISLDDVRLTSAQRDAAQDLIDATTEAMLLFPDQEAIEAAGYASIGDAPTGYEHFVNFAYLGDDRELDPNAIESIVMVVNPDGTKVVASAMYILSFDKTMEDVPDIAGELTTWHDHQNLCWDGARVVGTTDRTGQCERGVFRPTPPMLHVWLPNQEHPCGPFAGIEGSHGGGCDHGH
jgi:hypothetical protein